MIELERIFFKEMMMMMKRDLDLCQGLLFQGLGQAIQRLSRRLLGVTTTPRNPKFHLCSKQSLPAMVWWGWSHYIKHKTKKPVIQIPICWNNSLNQRYDEDERCVEQRHLVINNQSVEEDAFEDVTQLFVVIFRKIPKINMIFSSHGFVHLNLKVHLLEIYVNMVIATNS